MRLPKSRSSGAQFVRSRCSFWGGILIDEDRAGNYHADSQGTQLNYEVVAKAITEVRASRSLPRVWKACIDEDYRSRGGRH